MSNTLDTRVPSVSITRRSDGYYNGCIRYTDRDGAKKRLQVTKSSEQAARTTLGERWERLRENMPARDSAMSVAALVREWESRILPGRGVAESTREAYASTIRIWLSEAPARPGLDPIGAMRVSAVTDGHIDEYLAAMADVAGKSASTRKQVLSILKQAFSYGVKRRLVAVNPAREALTPAVDEVVEVAYTPAQVRALVSAMATGIPADAERGLPAVRPDSSLRAFVLTLALTGVRPGEALAWRWGTNVRLGRTGRLEVDAAGAARVHVEGTLVRLTGRGLVHSKGKGRRGRRNSRDLRLEPVLVDELQAQRDEQVRAAEVLGGEWADEGYVFASEAGTALDIRNLSKRFRRFTSRVVVDGEPVGGSFKRFRHTFATTLAAGGDGGGTDLVTLKSLTGHSPRSSTLTSTYAHAVESHRDDAMRRAARLLLEDGSTDGITDGGASVEAETA